MFGEFDDFLTTFERECSEVNAEIQSRFSLDGDDDDVGIDNPAIPQTKEGTEEGEEGKDHYLVFSDGNNIENTKHRFVLKLDPDLEGLCPICYTMARKCVPIDPGGPDEGEISTIVARST